MDIEKVRALLCVIEEKSISAAANKMDYTPSGVSRMMTALEEELGFSLLIRKKEGVSVTEECKIMLPYMRAYIKSEEECLQMVSKIRGMEIGRVSIGTAYSEYYRWLSECIKDFHKKYPGICLELSSGYSSELVDKVMDHKLDLAIVSRRDNVEEWILLRRDPMVVWVPAEHRLAALNCRLRNLPRKTTLILIQIM